MCPSVLSHITSHNRAQHGTAQYGIVQNTTQKETQRGCEFCFRLHRPISTAPDPYTATVRQPYPLRVTLPVIRVTLPVTSDGTCDRPVPSTALSATHRPTAKRYTPPRHTQTHEHTVYPDLLLHRYDYYATCYHRGHYRATCATKCGCL